MAHGVGIGLNIYAGAGGGAATGSNAELEGETQGFVFVGTDTGVLVSVKDTTTPANNRSNVDINAATSPVINSGTSPKLVLGSDGLYRWTPHNLFLQSQDYTGYALNGLTISANAIAAPDGTLTADKLAEDNTNTRHQAAANVVVVGGAQYTQSVYAKAGERTWILIDAANPSVLDYYAYFDLANGVVGTVSPGLTATITPVGNGWYRCAVTQTMAVAQSAWAHALITSTGDGVVTFTGTTGFGVYVWGSQLNRGATAQTYHATTATAWFGVPIEYDSVAGTYYVLTEPQATNLLWPSKPTGWSVGGSASTVNNDAVAPDGTLTATKLTLPLSSYYYGVFSGATPSAAYMPSIFIKRVSTTGTIAIQNPSDGGQGSWTIDVSLLPDAWTRIVRGHPAITGTAANFTVHPSGGGGILLLGVAGTVVAHIWHGQCELGSVATSPIPTFAATVTRADDNINVATSAIPFVPATNTVIADLRAIQPAIGTQQLWEFFANGGNRTGASVSSLGAVGVGNVSGGGFSGGIVNIGTLLANIRSKVGVTYAANDFAGTVDAGTVATGTGTLPASAPTTLYIGTEGPNFGVIAGKYRAFKYLPRRMSNAELQIETLLSEDGGQLILLGESAGLGIDFTTSDGLGSVAVKGHTTNLDNVPVDSFLTNVSATTPKLVLGQNGLYRRSPHNLLLQSQTLAAGSWVHSGATVTAGTVAAADGSMTGNKLVEVAAVIPHMAYQTAGVSFQAEYTFAVDMKAAERTWGYLRVDGGTESPTWFDLANGVVGTVSITMNSASITPLGNGWYRCAVTFTNPTGWYAVIGASTGNGVTTYLGVAGSGIYVARPQFCFGPVPADYLATTTVARYGMAMEYSGGGYYGLVEAQATNMVVRSSEIGTAPWNLNIAPVTQNVGVAPDGSLSADGQVPPAGGPFATFIQQAATISATNWTWSVFVKPDNKTNFWLDAYDGSPHYTSFVLTGAGSIGPTNQAGNTATITQLAGGWYRVTVTRVAASTVGIIDMSFADGDGVAGLTGDGTTVAGYLWGAQLEAGIVATSPIPTTSTTIARAHDIVTAPLSTIPALGSAYSLFANIAATHIFNQTDFLQVYSGGGDFARLGNANSNTNLAVITGGVLQANPGPLAGFLAGPFTKVAGRFVANDFQDARGGLLNVPDTSGTLPPVTTLSLTGSLASPLKFRGIIALPRGYSNAELEAKTADTPATGAQALLVGEANGMALDFTTALGTVAVRDVATPANVKNNLPVDSFLTQSGTSPKLVVGSDGVYRWSPHNMIAQSETLTGAGWFPIGVTVTVNAAASPTTGAMTVDRMVENTSDLTHNIWSPYFTAVAGVRYTASFIAKADGGSLVEAMIWSADGSLGISVGYDLSTGTGSAPVSPFGWTEAASSITALGSGWYRITVSGIPTVGSALSGVLAGFVGNHTGNPLAGMFVGEFQVNRGAVPTTYMATTTVARYGVPIEYGSGAYYALVEPQATNLFLQSNAFDTGWIPRAAPGTTTVTANQATAPDGTLTADKIDLNAVSAAQYTGVYQHVAVAAAAHTFSVWLKGAVGGESLYLLSYDGGANAIVSSRITLTTSWVRYSVTGTTTAAGWYWIIGNDMGSFVGTAATAAATIYAWGAQLETGSVATSPIPTGAATVTRTQDKLDMVTTSLPYSSAAGSWYVEFTTYNATLYQYLISSAAGTMSHLFVVSGTGPVGYYDGTTQQNTPNSVAINVKQKALSAYSGSTGSVGLNAGTVATNLYDGAFGGAANLGLGYDRSASAPGLIGRLHKAYFLPRRVTDADIVVRTTP